MIPILLTIIIIIVIMLISRLIGRSAFDGDESDIWDKIISTAFGFVMMALALIICVGMFVLIHAIVLKQLS